MVVLFCQLFSQLQHRVCIGSVLTADSGEYKFHPILIYFLGPLFVDIYY